MLELLFATVFVLALLLLVHTYFLYPGLLYLVASALPQSEQAEYNTLPSVALVIAAYNEEDVIADKIENSLELSYPDDRLSILVFSDASSDRTDEIVRSYKDAGVELIRIEGRVGKTECQNRVVDRIDEEIVVFSDANSMYEPDVITELVTAFEPNVGCVIGELKYHDSGNVDGESVYWKYESIIKRLESAVHSAVTGNGSIYAVRRSSYVPLSREAISDFAEPLALVSNGKRVKYEPAATAWENTGQTVEEELERRSRIVTRCWHTVASYAQLLNPVAYPVFSTQLFSHKVLRWLSPVLLGIIAVSNVALLVVSSHPLYVGLFGLQAAFYLIAGVGFILDQHNVSAPSVIHIPYYFLMANYGMLLGLWNFLSGRNIITWETATRETQGK